MVECLSAKSIKDDNNLNNEKGVFTLSVVKTEAKPNCNCRKMKQCLAAQCDDDLSFRRQEV
jgi:hypothetical protein